ncbi:hypothetical protein ACET3Z_011676 [Daucus carota]
MRNNQKSIFLQHLKEQAVYAITNFKVMPRPQSYRTVDMELAINFFYKTVIKEVLGDDVIPRYKFELKPFHSVASLVGEVKSLIDKASLSSTDATRNFFNIDYPPLNQLRDTLSVASEKGGVVLKRPTTMHFVAMDEQSVQQLTIKAVLELQIPMGKNQMRCLCEAEVVEILNGDGWYYECCATCARAVQKMEGKIFYPGCQEVKE